MEKKEMEKERNLMGGSSGRERESERIKYQREEEIMREVLLLP